MNLIEKALRYIYIYILTSKAGLEYDLQSREVWKWRLSTRQAGVLYNKKQHFHNDQRGNKGFPHQFRNELFSQSWTNDNKTGAQPQINNNHRSPESVCCKSFSGNDRNIEKRHDQVSYSDDRLLGRDCNFLTSKEAAA